MTSPQDHAGGKMDAEFCSTCAEPNGTLKPFDAVVQANAQYYVREQGVSLSAASAMAKALLASMPAWQTRR
jgi:hypothetical protein